MDGTAKRSNNASMFFFFSENNISLFIANVFDEQKYFSDKNVLCFG